MLLKFVWEFVRKFVWDTFTGFSEHPAQREAIDAREAMDRKSLPRINGFPPLSADSNFKKRHVQNICHGNGAAAALRPVTGIPLNKNLIVRPEAGTSRASASCRIAPHNQMTFTFEASGVTVPLHFRFCNPPARVGWPRSVCMAYQCRWWKENVSTFDAKRLSSSMQAILPVQVDCKT